MRIEDGTPPDAEHSQELQSWKEVADFFGVSIKTVQNWEKQWNLPIQRMPGRKGRVFAFTPELEEWRLDHFDELEHHVTAHKHRGNTLSPRWAFARAMAAFNNLRFLKIYAWVATSLFVALLGLNLRLHLLDRSVSQPVFHRLTENALMVMDKDNRTLWTKVFPNPVFMRAYSEEALSRRIWFGNIDEEPGIETLFVYYPVSVEKNGTQLICFSERGEEKWRFVPGRVVNDAVAEYSAVYVVANFAVAKVLGTGRQGVFVTSHHVSEHPNQFAVLDHRGRLLSEYWHSGHLEHIDSGDLDDDGVPEIFLGGVNNGHRSAVVVVLDPRDILGTSLQAEGDDTQIKGLPTGHEKAMVFFPRSCINNRLEKYNRVQGLTAFGGSVKVIVQELLSSLGVEITYILDPTLRPMEVRISDVFYSRHLQLESSGQLHHPASADDVYEIAKQVVVTK